MSKKIIIIIGSLLLSVSNYSQEKKNARSSYIRTNEKITREKEIEEDIKKFIDENIKKFKLTSTKTKEITDWFNAPSDGHEHSEKEYTLKEYLNGAKKAELRKLFLQQNPEKAEYFTIVSRPAPGVIRNACDNGGFEDMITDDYDFSRKSYVFGESIDCDLPNDSFINNFSVSNIVNYSFNVHATLTDLQHPSLPAYDLILYNNTSAPKLQIPVAKTGRYAVKLNNSFRPDSEQISVQTVATRMIKTFFLEPGQTSVSYNFNFICQNPLDHDADEQPRFIARLYDSNGVILSQNCLVSDVNNTMMFINAIQNPAVTPLLYTDWQCASLSTKGVHALANQTDREVTLEFIVTDCTLGAHIGTVYIDDICTTSECEDPVYGNLELDFDNVQLGNCPAFPLNVCGSYLVPHSINTDPVIYATVQQIKLNILKDGLIFNTISVPTTQSNNTPPLENTFCFQLQESDFGIEPLSGDFEFQIEASFLAGDVLFPITTTSAIAGPDVSFNDCNCCSSCCPEHHVVTEMVNSGLLHPKQAELTLIAKNIIHTGGIGLYHAGDSVTLLPPFEANTGSRLHAYIEGCSEMYQYRKRAKEIITEVVKHNPESIALEAVGVDAESVIKILPNPNNGIFKISLKGLTEGLIEVSDMNSTIIYQNTFKNQSDSEIDIKHSPNGIYIVSIVSGEKVYFGKVIKQ